MQRQEQNCLLVNIKSGNDSECVQKQERRWNMYIDQLQLHKTTTTTWMMFTLSLWLQ